MESFGLVHQVEVVVEEDEWGEANEMNNNFGTVKTEMVISGAKASTIDRDTYTESNVSDAINKIRNAQKAEQTFNGTASANEDLNDDAWGTSDDEDDDAPWCE